MGWSSRRRREGRRPGKRADAISQSFGQEPADGDGDREGSGTVAKNTGNATAFDRSIANTGNLRIYQSMAQEAPRQPAESLTVRLAPRLTVLADRESLLADLATWLAPVPGAPGPRIVVLCGMGGVGKTSVAVEYAYRQLGEVGVYWQFSGEGPAALAAEFGELAAQLGERGAADTRDPVASVHAVLARLPVPWLLIFDNATDLATVAAFLPKAGTGQVLITSQNPNWACQALDVPVLDPDAAATFLASRTGDPDTPAATELAGELDGLPLALEQAAAYIQATEGTLAGYLALFRHRRAEMLARGKPTAYSKTVATTWSVAFDHLTQTGPGAVGLLRLLAYCAPEAIPVRLLLQGPRRFTKRLPLGTGRVLNPLLKNPVATDDAIAALRRYSLISPSVAGFFTVHRLVQAVTRDQMPRKLAGRWKWATIALVKAAVPEDPSQPDTWPDFAALLPHAQEVLPAYSSQLQWIATYLGFRGNYAAARDLTQRVLEGQIKILGPEHPRILSVRVNHAGFTAQAGDPAGGRDLLSELLLVMERVLGPQHPETLATRSDLALFTGQAGDKTAARDQFAALVPVIEQALGPEHPYTLNTRGDLARSIGQAGDPATARDLLIDLQPLVERVLGPEDIGSVINHANLANWTAQAGDPAAARDLFNELLPVLERVFGGLEHPVNLAALKEFACWTGKAGNPAAARDLLSELVPVMERILGLHHPDTLAARNDLASWSREASDPAAGTVPVHLCSDGARLAVPQEQACRRRVELAQERMICAP